jgi:hypothetical protein
MNPFPGRSCIIAGKREVGRSDFSYKIASRSTIARIG